MKKRVSFLLAVAMILGMVIPVSAAEESVYGYLPVEYSQVTGSEVFLSAMYTNGTVFAEIYELAEMLGYRVLGGNKDVVALWNDTDPNLPFTGAIFSFTGTQVIRNYAGHFLDTYEAPCPSVRNEKGIWIPLDYAVTLLGGEVLIGEDSVRIYKPTASVGDLIYALMGDGSRYLFDWSEDYGYTEQTLQAMGKGANLLNLINGCLSMDGDSWLALFQQLDETPGAYDNKYGEELGLLLCTNSQDELASTAAEVADILEQAGLGGLTANMDAKWFADDGMLDALSKEYSEILANQNMPQSGKGKILTTARKAVNRLLKTRDDEILTQNVLTGLEKGMVAAGALVEMGGYISEFEDQEEFAVSALENFIADAKIVCLPENTVSALAASTKRMRSGALNYSLSRLVLENIDVAMSETVIQFACAPARWGLVSWSIASNVIPFLAEGFADTERFQLGLYGTMLQGDTYLWYLDLYDRAVRDGFTAESVAKLSQGCYLWLKSCYLTRQAAMSILDDKAEEEKFAKILGREKQINMEIADLLARLKRADASNEGYVLGFLPEDNREYLQLRDDTRLAHKMLLEPYASYLKVIRTYKEIYGDSCALSNFLGMEMIGGLSYVKLVDFDDDGSDELLLAYKETDSGEHFDWHTVVYDYDEDTRKPVRLFEGETAYGGGAGGNLILLTRYQGQTYLVTGLAGYVISRAYYGFQNGIFQKVRDEYGINASYSDEPYRIDGVTVSADTWFREHDRWNESKVSFLLVREDITPAIRSVEEEIRHIEEKASVLDLLDG